MQAASALERRQTARTNATVHAFLHCGGRFQHTNVVNYSPDGMQLRGTFGLHKDDPVEIELMSGTRLAGRVAWSLGDRTGIAFSERLPDTHPALYELSRAVVAKPD